MKIAILGAGKMGMRILEALIDGDYDIAIVDSNEQKLNQISLQYDVLTVPGDARSIAVLKQFEIEDYDFLLSCTGSDEVNLISASCAKTLGCTKVVARVTDPVHMAQMDFLRDHFGIDALINPDMLITSEIYRYLIEKYSLSNGIYTNNRIAMIEYNSNNEPMLDGLTLMDYRKLHPEVLIVGISRHGKVIIPHGKDIIQKDDILYLMGEKNNMMEFTNKFFYKTKNSDRQNIMIVGGGKTGFYLSKRLSEYGAYVKLIENSLDRCEYLSSNLRNVVVLHGNGTDISLLEEEGLDNMDAFVSATGFDEENLLLALTAKNHGIEDVISKISRESYDDLISTLGIDVVLNPLDISASAILRIINGEKRVLSSVLLQGQAELMELYVDSSMIFTNKPLKLLELPDYCIIAAVVRGSQTIIPNGDTIIKEGDHILVVCLLSSIGYIETLLKATHKHLFG